MPSLEGENIYLLVTFTCLYLQLAESPFQVHLQPEDQIGVACLVNGKQDMSRTSLQVECGQSTVFCSTSITSTKYSVAATVTLLQT